LELLQAAVTAQGAELMITPRGYILEAADGTTTGWVQDPVTIVEELE
jgi:hypothetical protein